VSRKKPPDCSGAAPNPQFVHRRNDLIQCRIRALRNQSQQFFRVLLQPQSAPPCGLCFGASGITPALQPFNRGTRAQIEALGSFPPRRPRFSSDRVPANHQNKALASLGPPIGRNNYQRTPAVTIPIPGVGVEVERLDRVERREVETTGRGGCDSKTIRRESPKARRPSRRNGATELVDVAH
jgi:hypothetical protein